MSGLNKEFNDWWNSDVLLEDNPYSIHTPMYWAWEGWVAGVRAEREACAKVCMEDASLMRGGTPPQIALMEAAAAIRARGSDAA